MWFNLANTKLCDIPWLICGDFNCLLNPEDKLGGKPFAINLCIHNFRKFISSIGFMDLDSNGPPYTWCNNRKGLNKIQSRIDRAFATPDWVNLFGNSSVTHLPRGISDHAPLLIQIRNVHKHKFRLFRFQPLWCSYPEVQGIITRNWNSPDNAGGLDLDFSIRLNNLRSDLSFWNRHRLGSLEKSLK